MTTGHISPGMTDVTNIKEIRVLIFPHANVIFFFYNTKGTHFQRNGRPGDWVVVAKLQA
jgi:hypothetical protein